MKRSKIALLVSALVLVAAVVFLIAFADACHEGNDPQRLDTLEEQVESDADGGG